MCTTCGCEQSETRIEGVAHDHPGQRIGDGAAAWLARRRRAAAAPHTRDLEHAHHGVEPAAHTHRDAESTAPAVETSPTRLVRIEQDILAKNDACAAVNRRWLAEHGVFALNLVSSPGSGKTTLLVRTIEALAGRLPVTVIEGDQQTSNDAERIRATGSPAIQVNTGKGCHLDADMVGQAIDRLQPPAGSLLMIENVGNLVCPAEFDLGEAHKVVILSVTEGEDKPLKYPNMFRAADLMLLAKIDLLPYLSFDVDLCVEYARQVNPRIDVLAVSSVSGDGLDPWLAWLERGSECARALATSPAASR